MSVGLFCLFPLSVSYNYDFAFFSAEQIPQKAGGVTKRTGFLGCGPRNKQVIESLRRDGFFDD